MRYSFSAEFVKILPPDTSFGDAWESLCFELLAAEHGLSGLQRIKAPDCGIDILRVPAQAAIQCKSDERGAFGSLSGAESVKSLRAAVAAKRAIPWQMYVFASNADYTGSARVAITDEAASLGIETASIEYWGPGYWNQLCENHFSVVEDRFDYRLLVTEAQVKEALEKARYYDQVVYRYAGMIQESDFVVSITNNRTPVVLNIPFAPDLTIENCLDSVRELLGISMDWTNYADLGTSSGPSISLVIDRRRQPFSQKVGDVLAAHPEQNLEFWITVRWKDEESKEGVPPSQTAYPRASYLIVNRSFAFANRQALSEAERQRLTLARAGALIQDAIWSAARRLKNPHASSAIDATD